MKKDRWYSPAGHEEEGAGAYADFFFPSDLFFFKITEIVHYVLASFSSSYQLFLHNYYSVYL